MLLRIGHPIEIDAILDAQREQLPDSVQVSTLTALVAERLHAVTLNFASREDAERLRSVGETLSALIEPTPAIGDDRVPLARMLAVVRRLDRAHSTLRERRDAATDARIVDFERRVQAFRGTLDALRIDAHDVAISAEAGAGARFAVREAVLAAIIAPFGAWGRITHVVPIRLARFLALRNVRNRDEPAMRTLVAGLLLVVVAYAVQTTIVYALFGAWWAALFFVSLVPSASSDLRYGDRTRRARERARAYFLFRRHPETQHTLLAEAEWIRREAGDLERLAS